jgi:hypothetical protein
VSLNSKIESDFTLVEKLFTGSTWTGERKSRFSPFCNHDSVNIGFVKIKSSKIVDNDEICRIAFA